MDESVREYSTALCCGWMLSRVEDVVNRTRTLTLVHSDGRRSLLHLTNWDLDNTPDQCRSVVLAWIERTCVPSAGQAATRRIDLE